MANKIKVKKRKIVKATEIPFKEHLTGKFLKSYVITEGSKKKIKGYFKNISKQAGY